MLSKFARTEQKATSLWIFSGCSSKLWILSLLEHVAGLPTPGCKAVSSERLHSNHKEAKTTKIQNKKVAVTLETRQRLEDSPSCKVLATTSTECFRSVQHKLLSKPTTRKWESSDLGKMHDFIYTGTHTHTLTPIYLCDFSYFFYLCYDVFKISSKIQSSPRYSDISIT